MKVESGLVPVRGLLDIPQVGIICGPIGKPISYTTVYRWMHVGYRGTKLVFGRVCDRIVVKAEDLRKFCDQASIPYTLDGVSDEVLKQFSNTKWGRKQAIAAGVVKGLLERCADEEIGTPPPVNLARGVPRMCVTDDTNGSAGMAVRSHRRSR